MLESLEKARHDFEGMKVQITASPRDQPIERHRFDRFLACAESLDGFLAGIGKSLAAIAERQAEIEAEAVGVKIEKSIGKDGPEGKRPFHFVIGAKSGQIRLDFGEEVSAVYLTATEAQFLADELSHARDCALEREWPEFRTTGVWAQG